jgi:hypothetical protein
LKDLAALKQLQTLDLSRTGVTDRGLKGLAGLRQLRMLRLRDTKVTNGGVADLQQALPNLRILR